MTEGGVGGRVQKSGMLFVITEGIKEARSK